jgi:DNA replication protein DnaC
MIYGPAEKQRFILIGDSGSGKSHSALATKKYLFDALTWAWRADLIDTVKGVEMIEAPELVDMDDEEFGYWTDGLQHTRVLFLEDIGTEIDQYRSGLPRKRLYQILELFADRWLFVTTNIFEETWREKWDARVDDRLHRNSEIVTLRDVPSYTVWKMRKEAGL